MIWDYNLSTNTIWTSFDYGQVEADTYDEAYALALIKVKYDVDKANTVFKHCEITEGFTIDMDYTQLEVTLADPQPLPDNPPKPEPQALTKFSERNLSVIENFILHVTHCSENDNDADEEQSYSPNELYQMGRDYIKEDHVDGEGSPQAIREFALSCELIRESVDINQSELVYDIYASDITGLIYAVPNDPNETLYVYKLIKPQAEIEVEYRDEILDYCLSIKTKEDEVSLGDIFVHGKYTQLITEV